VENEILQAAVRGTKDIVITRNRNKAAKFAWVNCCTLVHYIISLSKRRWVKYQLILRLLKHLEEIIFNSAIVSWFLFFFSKILIELTSMFFWIPDISQGENAMKACRTI
jgi:hypothetical protein